MSGALDFGELLAALRLFAGATVSAANPHDLRRFVAAEDSRALAAFRAVAPVPSDPARMEGPTIYGREIVRDARLPAGVAVLQVPGARARAVAYAPEAAPAAAALDRAAELGRHVELATAFRPGRESR
ncbi:hypothetical protein [Rhodovulum marinum]|uniref:Uncharacterized protein n=1 Tax=Rhodovulum marinum TaxID=320662 RepID=A0A4R2QAW4_9RHOB|nr:hypothetical protein [Rhodovulum marinum]TCP43965.1 hypothetical protein EV662_10150 [Rhodovulum marinum]